ncbi:MAG: hypothetical protein DWQ31_18195 [Planctomycetota bacterium]|nr:MAG: hypothetical protein DWQ31_18195 [Planctomycetota bacterium]REJ93515.1 MAG: hypothetical protein DWQ35_10265 [Planctomycetota bacterium]
MSLLDAESGVPYLPYMAISAGAANWKSGNTQPLPEASDTIEWKRRPAEDWLQNVDQFELSGEERVTIEF